jgi:hypothetical protein
MGRSSGLRAWCYTETPCYSRSSGARSHRQGRVAYERKVRSQRLLKLRQRFDRPRRPVSQFGFDIAVTAGCLDYFASLCETRVSTTSQTTPGQHNFVLRVPYGVTAAIIPWNSVSTPVASPSERCSNNAQPTIMFAVSGFLLGRSLRLTPLCSSRSVPAWQQAMLASSRPRRKRLSRCAESRFPAIFRQGVRSHSFWRNSLSKQASRLV